MPATEQVVEIVRFTATGLDEITARTRVFAGEVQEATKQQKALLGLMNDPRTQQHQARMAAINRQTELMALKMRNLSMAADVASGAIGRQSVAVAKLNADYDKLTRAAQLQSLVAQHGKLGGLLRHHAADVSTLKNAALGATIGVGALGMGLVRSGLQGTVEGYRLANSWERVGKQVAAIAIPFLDKLANILGRVAGWMEKLTGRQQDMILGFGAMAVAAGPLLLALKGIYGIGGAALRLGGGVLTGLGVGAGAGGGAGAGAGGLGAGLGNAAATGAGAAAGSAGRSGLARAGAWIGRNALTLAKGGLVLTPFVMGATSGDYGRLRESGVGRGQAFLTSNKMALQDIWHSLTGSGENPNAGWRTRVDAATEKKRRDVMPLEVGLNEAGSGAMRIQEEVLKATVARAEEDAARKAAEEEARKALEENTHWTKKLAEEMARGGGLSMREDESYSDWLRRLRTGG